MSSAVIRAISEDEQVAYGLVYAPLQVDTYGEVMTAEAIKQMAHRFMQLDLSAVIDTQHNNEPNGSYPVESFIAREGDPDYPAGSWVLGIKVTDPELWSKIKSGEYNGFSFEALVRPEQVVMTYAYVRDHVGRTEKAADGHSHSLFVQLSANGSPVVGRTSVNDGHSHEIVGGTATKESDGHAHRFFL